MVCVSNGLYAIFPIVADLKLRDGFIIDESGHGLVETYIAAGDTVLLPLLNQGDRLRDRGGFQGLFLLFFHISPSGTSRSSFGAHQRF